MDETIVRFIKVRWALAGTSFNELDSWDRARPSLHSTAEDFRFAISAKLELVILRDRGQIRTRGGQRKREGSEAMGEQKTD